MEVRTIIRNFYGLTDNLMLVSFLPYFDKKLEMINKSGKTIETNQIELAILMSEQNTDFSNNHPEGHGWRD